MPERLKWLTTYTERLAANALLLGLRLPFWLLREALAAESEARAYAGAVRVDAEIERGWGEVAERMDRWGADNYQGHWLDARYATDRRKR